MPKHCFKNNKPKPKLLKTKESKKRNEEKKNKEIVNNAMRGTGRIKNNSNKNKNSGKKLKLYDQ